MREKRKKKCHLPTLPRATVSKGGIVGSGLVSRLVCGGQARQRTFGRCGARK